MRLRANGAQALRAPSAALDAAPGYHTENGALVVAAAQPAMTYAIFGQRPNWIGWMCHDVGRPPPALLARVRRLNS